MKKIEDPDLGIMNFDGRVWILESRVRFNDRDIPLKIRPEDSDTLAISAVQRQAAKISFNLPSDSLVKSAPAVVQNYECYDEALSGEELPELENPVDVWRLVEPDYISIPPHYEVTIPTFILYAECFWDEEHGLEVRFRNGYADESNQQGHLGVELD